MKVLVAGANGITGRLLIKQLTEKGYKSYGMVPKEEQIKVIEQLGGTAVAADLESNLEIR